MADPDAHSVVINIPKPRKYYKEIKKEEVKPKKTPEKDSKLPEISIIKPLPARFFKNSEILLPYLRYSNRQEKLRLKERLGISLRDNYKIAYKALRKRLYTKDPEDDVRAVTDFDPTFFKCVKSTTLASYVAPYKSLSHELNSLLRLKHDIGYRYDCILNIDNNFKKEQAVFDSALKNYMKQVKYLDDFISVDYNKSMEFLSRWDKLKAEVIKQDIELKYLAAKEFTLTSQIVGFDYRYGIQQMYGRFLYYLSPPSWRLKNRNFARSIEIEAKGFDLGISNEEDNFQVIFEKLKNECSRGLIKPALYFQQPNDLLEIFDSIEQQQLHHFTHVERLAPHTIFIKKGIKLLKEIIAQDSVCIKTVITEFEKMNTFSEEQYFQLRAKFFQILNTAFYDCVGAPDILKLQIHLEFCYAKVYNETPMNLGLMATAKALEAFYLDHCKRLESFTANHVQSAIKQAIELERRKFRKAKLAARELRLFERLERALLRAYAPMAVQNISFEFKVKKKSAKKTAGKMASKKLIKRLTDTEMEYLAVFTDWTEKEDPANYIRSLSMEEHNIQVRSSK